MMTDSIVTTQLVISAAMIGLTTLVHAIFVATAAALYRATWGRVQGPVRFFRDVGVLVVLSFWLMLAHCIEIGMWAWLFLKLGIFDGLEAALYFAAVSYTTLGFGDILLPVEWRLLAGAIAASGLLLFGLSAAFLIDTTAKLRLGGDR